MTEKTNAYDIFAQTMSAPDLGVDYGNITLTVGAAGSSGNFSSLGYGSSSDTIVLSGSSSPYVLNGANGASSYTWTTTTTPMTVQQSGQIDLKGDGADIVVNGESMMETLKEIKEMLMIPSKLNRDTQLEAEFDELKQAAKHYQALLEKYKDQKRVWDILKTQD